MRMRLASWGGTSINDTNFEPQEPIGVGNGMGAAIPNFIDMGEGDPVLGGKTLQGSQYTFRIMLLGETDAELETQRDLLNSIFRPNDFELKQLVGEDVDDSDKEWYLEGFVVMPPTLQEGAVKNLYNITIALNQPYWIEADEQSVNWNIGADTETQAVTNNGNVFALPTFEITPAANKGSNTIRGRLYIGIRHTGWEDYFLNNLIAVDLTPAGWDTATLIAGGDMNASGNDIVVSVDGVTTYRWLTGIDTAATHIWSNILFKPAPSLTLQTALDNSTLPASIVCGFTATSITLPQNSTLQIGSEFFTYSTLVIDNINKTVTFTPTTRGAKGSTKATHSVNDAVYWIEHDIWITYGTPGASAPVQNESQKPSMNLATSSNDEWIWDDFSAISPTDLGISPRFVGMAKKFTEEDYATNGNADPYEVMGIQLESILVGNIVYQQNIWGKISLWHPGKFDRFICAAEKWRSGSTFGTLTFFVGDSEVEASPSVANTWEAIAIDITSAVPSGTAYVDFRGSLGTTLPVPQARVQVFSMTVEIYAPPTITVIEQAAPTEVYRLGALIENETNDEGIQLLDVETEVDETTTIDCGDLEAYKEDGTRIRAKLALTGARRNEWLTLDPGSNTIRYTDTGTNDVDVVIKVRGRNTI